MKPCLLALALASAAVPGAAAERQVEAGKMFQFADKYLALPAAQRTQFTPTYQVIAVGAPLSAVRLAYVTPAGRTPVPLRADGRLERLPSDAEFRGKLWVDTPDGVKLRMRMSMACTLAPAREIAAARLTGCIDQVNGAVRKMAGPLSLLAPRFDRVSFPGAAGGAVVAEGGRRPLPVQEGDAVFEPAAWKGARAVTFDRPPQSVLPDEKPKGR